MSIQHKDVPDIERHEPKGISTAPAGTVYISNGDGLSGSWDKPPVDGQASASEGMILRADGAGNIAFVYPPEGFGTYQDDGTQVVNNTYSKLLCNGLGSATITSNLPYEIRGTSQLWDSTSSHITPINELDTYAIRINFDVTSETGSPTELTIQMDIGDNETSPANPIVTQFESAGKATPYPVSQYYGFYTGSTYLANKGRLFIKTDSGTATISGVTITLIRLTSGSI